jgi:hypothetical protein
MRRSCELIRLLYTRDKHGAILPSGAILNLSFS